MYKLSLCLSALLSLSVAQEIYNISSDQCTQEYHGGCRRDTVYGMRIDGLFFLDTHPRKLRYPSFCCSDYYIRFSNSSVPTMATLSFGDRESYVVGITMSSINISEILPGTFQQLRYLKCLDLSNNNLSYIKNGTFNRIQHLYDLNLSNNGIKHISENAFDETPLRKLFLQNNMISSLENNLFSWQRATLTLIDLSSNLLKKIKYTLAAMEILEMLKLNDNDFEIIDFDNVYSTEIHLRNNNLSQIKTLGTRIKAIDLGENNIHFFENLSSGSIQFSILELYLSKNKIQLSTNSFSSVPNLTHLHLDNNKLNRIPNIAFRNLKSLVLLDISHNDILHLQYGTFEFTPVLQYLNISYNKFTEVQLEVFSPLHKLRELNFRKNQIGEFDIETLLFHSPEIQRISLHGNLWKCKTLTNIVKYCQTKNVEIIPGNSTDFDNVLGNACYNDDFDMKNNNTEINQTHDKNWEPSNNNAFFNFFSNALGNNSFPFYNSLNEDYSYSSAEITKSHLIFSIPFLLFSIFISLFAIFVLLLKRFEIFNVKLNCLNFK